MIRAGFTKKNDQKIVTKVSQIKLYFEENFYPAGHVLKYGQDGLGSQAVPNIVKT